MMRDVFLCHASEDKQQVVRPLYEALVAGGISCWLDEAEVHWGDSIVEKVNNGLRDSQFVIVVLSTAFLAKPWPRRELASAISDEASSGAVRVLPLLVGKHSDRQTILDQLPLLRDKLHLAWEGDPTRILQALRGRLVPSKRLAQVERDTTQNARSTQLYCTRCGAKPGTRSECTGGYTHHAFKPGTGAEFCTRCGAKPEIASECTGGYTHHAFKPGTGAEFCTRCGATPGTRTECTGGYTHHAFNSKI